jgi:uncharacterized Zn finger protein (UPF0148 family)
MFKAKEEQKSIRTMADMLRQGETLTSLACPACSAPLFRLKNDDLWCVTCQKKVIVIREGEEESKVKSTIVMENLEKTLLSKIEEIQNKIQRTGDVGELQKLSNALSELLVNLEQARKTKKT